MGITAGSFAVTLWFILHYRLQIFADPYDPHGLDYQYYLYDKPWSRVPAFLVGLSVPWMLIWARNRYALDHGAAPKSTKAVLIISILVSLALGIILTLLFITVTDQDAPSVWGVSARKFDSWTTLDNALYLTFARPVWALSHAVIVVACYFDYVPLINGFLSHWIWTPLSRLTYCAYLLHPLVINLRCGLAVQYFQFTAWTVFQNFATDSALAYAAAIVAWCLVEKPVATLIGFVVSRPKVRPDS